MLSRMAIWTLIKKIRVAVSGLIVLVAGLGFVGSQGVVQMRQNLEEVVTLGSGMKQQAHTEGLLLEQIQAAKNYVLSDDRTFVQHYERLSGQFEATITEALKGAVAAGRTAEQEALQNIQNGQAAFDHAFLEVQKLAAAKKSDAAVAYSLTEFDAAAEALHTALQSVIEANEIIVKQLQEQALKNSSEALTRILGTTLALILSIILVAIFLPRSLFKTLNLTMQALEAVAQGDLTQRLDIETQDEVGRMARALDQAVANMHATLCEIFVAAHDTAQAATELSTASQQLSVGSQEQATSLEETAASLEEITGTVRQNAGNARQASMLSVGTQESAEKGGAVVAAMITSTGEMNTSFKKIVDITTVIDEIAFQTNLLALNAAVEAARAGEQGRGFAVVAAEVRSLAQRCATAAKEIATLIKDADQKIQTGSEQVIGAGKTLEEIVASVKQVTELMADIAAASQEQAAGIDQVNQAVTRMDQVVQVNSAQTEQLSSTAQSLESQAERLQTQVGRFQMALQTQQETAGRPHPVDTVHPAPEHTALIPVHAPVRTGAIREREQDFEEF